MPSKEGKRRKEGGGLIVRKGGLLVYAPLTADGITPAVAKLAPKRAKFKLRIRN